MLILNDLPAIHWVWAGAVIAAVTLTLQFFINRSLGISTGLEKMCSFVSALPYFRRPSIHPAGSWRLFFLAGLVTAGALSAVLGGGWSPTWDAGILDRAFALTVEAKVAWMFVGGLCIGFGTRLASGCTSGHGIFGMSNFHKSSLIATCVFMAAGIATTQIIYRLVAG